MEGVHWWYRGMQTITETLLDCYQPGDSWNAILDAGCGTGGMLTACLSHRGIVTGVDLSPLAMGFCQTRGAQRLARASILDLPFAAATFDLVISFDVLYEDSVPDDRGAIREFARVLREGGVLFLRLPAYDWLRGEHDRVINTARRYRLRQVVSMLRDNGLEVELASYANMFLFPFALIKRSLERVIRNPRPVSDLAFRVGPLNSLFERILAMEAALIPRFPLPFGLSVLAIARKDSR